MEHFVLAIILLVVGFFLWRQMHLLTKADASEWKLLLVGGLATIICFMGAMCMVQALA